jgi:hypothetical protein
MKKLSILISVFIMENLSGDQVNLADFRGKVVLLNFWATW